MDLVRRIFDLDSCVEIAQRHYSVESPAGVYGFEFTKTREIKRPTRFRACTRKSGTAKGLRADDRPDLIAVDIDIARLDPF